MLELLAPAGSMEALRAAVQNGANAVYLGCGTFNARQSAKNFTPQSLVEAVKYCHIRGVAVHLTLNTLVSDKEMPELIELIRHAAASCVDAFIVQDLGVAQLCRQIAPKVAIHGSTQMTIHSLPGVLMCAAMGMTRVVLSRELNRDEIRYICKNSPIEIEVFGHGALCMCYSGQCYLSAAIGGRSGNRGRCAQPCRQSYGYNRWEERYPLSLKDNCLIPYLQELEEMGVASLKLEGRMKRPEYVATVTRVYREALDTGRVTKTMAQELYTAFNRQGFTDGYYTGKLGAAMFGIRENTEDDPRWLKEAQQTYETAENGRVPLQFIMRVTPQECWLTATDPEGHSCTVYGPLPEPAMRMGLNEEMLAARLTKTGGTPYHCAGTSIYIDPGLMLSASAINGMRRDALNQITALRARRENPVLNKAQKVQMIPGPKTPPELTVQVTTREQVTDELLRCQPAALYIPLHLLTADTEWCRKLARRGNVCAVLPRILHDGELPKVQEALTVLRAMGVKEVLAGNLGMILAARQCGMRIRGDYGLNIYNSVAMNALHELELRSATLSFEMTLPQIRDVSKAVPCEILIYGRLPLMVTENCIIQGKTGSCSCTMGPTKLADKTGAEFHVIKDGASCRSVLLNGKKLHLMDRHEDLSHLGLWATRLYFTTENGREVDQVLRAYQEGAAFDPGACTRGLYLRGID